MSVLPWSVFLEQTKLDWRTLPPAKARAFQLNDSITFIKRF
jgi:hypothetical protein